MDDDAMSEALTLVSLVEKLDETELLALERLVQARLQSLQISQREAGAPGMASFELGDTVVFDGERGERVSATVVRRNKKTLSLVDADGQRWKRAPELCEHAHAASDDLSAPPTDRGGNVTVLATRRASSEPAVVWSGGVVQIPAFVDDRDEPYQPLLIMWLDGDGLVVGTAVQAPDDDCFDAALASVQGAFAAPMAGSAHRPDAIVVNSAELAEYLDARLADVDVRHGPTPMLQEAFDGVANMAQAADEQVSYLQTGLEPARIAAFFEASAALYISQPWAWVPHDGCLIGVSIPALGLRNAVLSVLGQQGQHFALVLYDDIRAYGKFLVISDLVSSGSEITELPAHRALNFEDGAHVPAAIRKEIAEYGWQVDNASAYPVLRTIDQRGDVSPMAAIDVALFEALSRALVVALKDRKKLQRAWDGGAQYQRAFDVAGDDELLHVELRAPYPFEFGYSSTTDPSDAIMIGLARLAHSASEPDFDEYAELCQRLEDKFFASPERSAVATGASIVTPLMHFALQYHSCTIATLQYSELENIILEILPRKVMMPASEAAAAFEDGRAFYRFLQREYALAQAGECIDLFDHDRQLLFAAALSGDGSFGPGDELVAQAMLPGLEQMTNGDGADYQPAAPARPVDSRAKKKKRKASKTARKKNR